jgi:hypothetical protein
MDEQDRKLEERLKELPREVPPPRDLWPEISARIDEREARRPSRVVAAAFVGAIAVAAAVAILVQGSGESRWQGDAAATASGSAAASAAGTGASAGFVEEEAYEVAAETLRVEFEARRSEEPPAVVAVVDENVRIVDEAIRAVRAALAAHPDDAELRADLDRAHQDKLDVLRAATELPVSAEEVER